MLTTRIFKSLDILNIYTRAEHLRLNHVFNILNSTCPDYMNENFLRFSRLHQHNTRGSTFNLILGVVLLISKFQESKLTVLAHFIVMPLQTGTGCLMILSQKTEICF